MLLLNLSSINMHAFILIVFVVLNQAANSSLNTTYYSISTINNCPQKYVSIGLHRFNKHELVKSASKEPKIQNLNTVITTFGKQNCLTLIDNHKGVELPILTYPAILRQIQPATVVKSNENSYDILWIHSDLLKANQTISGVGNRINCIKNNTSKLFQQGFPIHSSRKANPQNELCINLDMFRFSSNIKPWKCQIQIQLYPNNRFLSETTSIFHYNISTNPSLFERLPPSTVPPIHMIIMQRPIKEKSVSWLKSSLGKFDIELDALTQWISSTVQLNSKYHKHQIQPTLNPHLFLIGYLEETVKGLYNFQVKIESFYYLEICGHCTRSFLLNPEIIKYSTDMNYIPNFINGKAKTIQESNTLWNIDQLRYNDKNDRIFSGIINHLRLCQNYFTESTRQTKKTLVNSKFGTPHERLFHALAHLIQWSMVNFTYPISEREQCINGRISGASTYGSSGGQVSMLIKGEPSKHSIYQILSLPETITQLRFVSCGGDRGKKFISFWQLLKMYDNYVWLCIFISSISIALFIGTFSKQQLVRNNKQTGLYLLKVVKILLLQVDPSFHKAITTETLRWAVGSFLLVGIVLSNAYKSEKVYKLMTMGKPIPYEKFQELLENNFTILTRSAYIYYDYGSLLYSTRIRNNGLLQNLTKVSPHCLTYKREFPHMLSLTSEVYEWDKASTYNGENSVTLTSILNHTKLHPSMEKILVEKIKPFNLKSNYKHQSSHFTDYMRNNVWQAENSVLLDFISKCNKTAIVAPDFVVNELGRRLISNNTSNVYVSKESYSSISTSLVFSGWITRTVLNRFWWVKESGLWDWWTKFIKSSKVFNEEISSNKKGLERPSMSGNIFMLFVMLLFGGVASGILFVCEMYIVVIRYLKQRRYKRDN